MGKAYTVYTAQQVLNDASNGGGTHAHVQARQPSSTSHVRAIKFIPIEGYNNNTGTANNISKITTTQVRVNALIYYYLEEEVVMVSFPV